MTAQRQAFDRSGLLAENDDNGFANNGGDGSQRPRRGLGDGRTRSRPGLWFNALELLEWTYRDQRVHRIGSGAPALGWGSSSTLAALGRTVDEGGGWLSPVPAVHPAAEAVHSFVCQFAWMETAALIGHAQIGDRPMERPACRCRCVPAWRRDALGVVRQPQWERPGHPHPRAIRYLYDRNRHAIACLVEHEEENGGHRGCLMRVEQWLAYWRVVLAVDAHFRDPLATLPGVGVDPLPSGAVPAGLRAAAASGAS